MLSFYLPCEFILSTYTQSTNDKLISKVSKVLSLKFEEGGVVAGVNDQKDKNGIPLWNSYLVTKTNRSRIGEIIPAFPTVPLTKKVDCTFDIGPEKNNSCYKKIKSVSNERTPKYSESQKKKFFSVKKFLFWNKKKKCINEKKSKSSHMNRLLSLLKKSSRKSSFPSSEDKRCNSSDFEYNQRKPSKFIRSMHSFRKFNSSAKKRHKGVMKLISEKRNTWDKKSKF